MGLIQWVIDWVNRSTPDGWLSLWGSILGFVGIIWTINHTKKQFNEDKRISVKPYLDFKLEHTDIEMSSIGKFTINVLKNLNKYEIKRFKIIITNLGNGNCIGLTVTEIAVENQFKENDIKPLGNIKAGGCYDHQSITFRTNYGDILSELEEKYINKTIGDDYEEFQNTINKETLNLITVEFEYKDILENRYKKVLRIETYIEFEILTEDDPFIVSGLEFKDVWFSIIEGPESEILLKKS